jgi:signal peptidase I
MEEKTNFSEEKDSQEKQAKKENSLKTEKPEKEKKDKSIVKKIIEWVIYIAILVVIVFGTPKALRAILDTEYPIASITSGSMWPVLKEGDLVFIKGVEGKKDVAVGEIVVFNNSRGFTIHRVIRLNEMTFVTKGDANNKEDPPISYDRLVGKTVNYKKGKPIRIPFLGKLSQMFARN